jgi:hypothetical protein
VNIFAFGLGVDRVDVAGESGALQVSYEIAK